jgi:Zn finger protein HypA/HybF involved in hydrogenase expression
MSDTVVVFLEGGLVNDVSNLEGESVPYHVIDHDAWEGNECPVCRGDGVKVINDKKVIQNGIEYMVGGAFYCPTCGAEEYMSGEDMIKILNRIEEGEITL